MFQDLKLKRKFIELKHFETWLGQGRGSFHLENLKLFTSFVYYTLKFTGLLPIGEKNAKNPIIRRICFEFDNLPAEFDGFKMLHLSDIHADALAGLAEVVAEKIEDLEVDLCVLTGDYRFEVHGPCHAVYHNLEKILPKVKARYGMVGVLGNHDFAEEVIELERMGVRMLINESFELKIGNASIAIIGVDDPHYYGCDDLDAAMRGLPHDLFKLLLVHSPEIIKEAEAKEIDLYLCGHTHGGQICLPLIGPIIVNANCSRKYTRGIWQYKKVKGYTNAGVGSSGVPVRFFCPPEIGVIELRRSNPSPENRS
jgi:predicted MPP superfamily phosphohydrolase